MATIKWRQQWKSQIKQSYGSISVLWQTRNSFVSVQTSLWTIRFRVQFSEGERNVLSSKTYSSVLSPTQTDTKRFLGVLSPGVKLPRCESTNSVYLFLRLSISGASPLPPTPLSPCHNAHTDNSRLIKHIITNLRPTPHLRTTEYNV